MQKKQTRTIKVIGIRPLQKKLRELQRQIESSRCTATYWIDENRKLKTELETQRSEVLKYVNKFNYADAERIKLLNAICGLANK